jgi:hypothetical protein
VTIKLLQVRCCLFSVFNRGGKNWKNLTGIKSQWAGSIQKDGKK